METSSLPVKGFKFDLYSALMAVEQWGFHNVPHLPFKMVICEDPWHSHLLPSVWQWNCYYLFLRLRSVAAGFRTLNLALAGQMLELTPPPTGHSDLWLRLKILSLFKSMVIQVVKDVVPFIWRQGKNTKMWQNINR